jgi:electron transport complex protein RnfE
MGATHVMILLVAALFLILRRSVSAIVFFTETISVLAFSFFYNNMQVDLLPYTLGGDMLLFGIIFLSCDYSTVPKTRSSRFLYGLIVGLMIILFQYFGKAGTAIVFAVIIAAPFGIELDRRALSFAKMLNKNKGSLSLAKKIFNKPLHYINETITLLERDDKTDEKRTKTEKKINDSALVNGLFKKNPILVSGMIIAPAVIYSNTFLNAFTLSVVFTLITLITLTLSSFIPKKVVYTIRIILYTIIGAIVYIPVIMLLNYLIPEQIAGMGIFAPLLIVNSLIVSKSETTFFAETKGKMFVDVIFSILGYDIIVMLFGFVRELISTGSIGNNKLGMPMIFSGLSMPFGGFLLLGIFAAAFRAILLIVRSIEK